MPRQTAPVPASAPLIPLVEDAAQEALPAVARPQNTWERAFFGIDFTALRAHIRTAEDVDWGDAAFSQLALRQRDYRTESAFCAVRLTDGMVLGAGLDREFFAASMIKCPYTLWICTQIDAGAGDLSEELSYLRVDRIGGTGVIRKQDRSSYTVQELIYYTIVDSDNDAYSILYRRFGTQGYNRWLSALQTRYLYLSSDSMWAYCTPRDMALVFSAVCEYGASGAGCSAFFLDTLSAAQPDYLGAALRGQTEAPTLTKYGYVDGAFHESGAVADPYHPALVAVYTAGYQGERDITFITDTEAALYSLLRGA